MSDRFLDDPSLLWPIAVVRDGPLYHTVQLSEDFPIGGLSIAAPAWLVCDPIRRGRTVLIREVLAPAEFEGKYTRRDEAERTGRGMGR